MTTVVVTENNATTLCAADGCCVLLDCQLPCSVLSPALHSFVACIADCCSLCQSPLTVAWIPFIGFRFLSFLVLALSMQPPSLSVEFFHYQPSAVTLILLHYTSSSSSFIFAFHFCSIHKIVTIQYICTCRVTVTGSRLEILWFSGGCQGSSSRKEVRLEAAIAQRN
jgi:hypothetical protein